MIDLKKLKDEDPIRRMVEKESGLDELSPMDPPDAFKPPTVDALPYEELSPFLQKMQFFFGPDQPAGCPLDM